MFLRLYIILWYPVCFKCLPIQGAQSDIALSANLSEIPNSKDTPHSQAGRNSVPVFTTAHKGEKNQRRLTARLARRSIQRHVPTRPRSVVHTGSTASLRGNALMACMHGSPT